jgi:hypothetical protein
MGDDALEGRTDCLTRFVESLVQVQVGCILLRQREAAEGMSAHAREQVIVPLCRHG